MPPWVEDHECSGQNCQRQHDQHDAAHGQRISGQARAEGFLGGDAHIGGIAAGKEVHHFQDEGAGEGAAFGFSYQTDGTELIEAKVAMGDATSLTYMDLPTKKWVRDYIATLDGNNIGY